MTRTAPDPRYADAVRDELQRRARGRSALPHLVLQVGLAAAVLVLAAAVLIGVQRIRAVPPGDGAPGVISPAPTLDPTPTLTPTSTPTPTSTSTSTSTPTSTPTPTSTSTPTGGADTPAPSPDATPDVTATPDAATPAVLLRPTGARLRTDDEIRADAAARGFGAVWAEQAVLDTHCMAEHGFVYDTETGFVVTPPGLSASDQQAYATALFGPDSAGPYDWRTAGCHGLSVHLTGQDHAN